MKRLNVLSDMDRLTAVVLIILGSLLIAIAVSTLRWRMGTDSATFMYYAFLMDRFGYVPYRDIFENNMPGAYFVYLLIGKVFGYGSEIGFRIADLTYLVALLGVTWFWLKRFGQKVAWLGIIAFGIVYFREGIYWSFQREYLTLLPISGAVWMATSFTNNNVRLKCFGIGLLFGLAALIKPLTPIGLPFVILYVILDNLENVRNRPRQWIWALGLIFYGLLGLLSVLLALSIYLLSTGAMSAFVDIVTNWWPLYNQMDGAFVVLTGPQRLSYMLHRIPSPQLVYLAPATLGALIALFQSTLTHPQKRLVLLLSALAMCYAVYPVLGGKFYSYHYIIMDYFAATLGALCLVARPERARVVLRWLPISVVLIFLFSHIIFFVPGAPGLSAQEIGGIAAYLKAHSIPGDRVQPLDNVNGALHAMLIANLEIATPFVYDWQFYEAVSTPYTQDLRRRFIDGLKATKPMFILKILDSPRPQGPGTASTFPELQDLLNTDYTSAIATNTYVIYQRQAQN